MAQNHPHKNAKSHFYFEYHRATRTLEGFEKWLQEWVIGVGNQREFLQRLSDARIARLKPQDNLWAPAVNFGY